MAAELSKLEPQAVWSQFDRILQIPRPSKHEQRIAAHVLELASRRGVSADRDGAGNIVVRVPASAGHEQAPLTVLQSHLDMVCEKNSGTEHDFMQDPIRPRIEGDWVYATGTTLGADNGIGVSCALALLEAKDVTHGPLELLFTLDEETGLTGAKNLSPKLLHGRRMLNLDSEEDGSIYIGCAGGRDSKLRLRPVWSAATAGLPSWRLAVTGLRGGHSGVQIHENRGNAIKILARLLRAAQSAGARFELSALAGGGKHNAIPREASAELWAGKEDVDKIRAVLEQLRPQLRIEFEGIEEKLQAELTSRAGAPAQFLDGASRDRLLRLLEALPHGVLGMSLAVPGMVETSNNVAVVTQDEEPKGTVTVWTSSRSSVAPILDALVSQIRSVGELAGCEVETADGYPGWKPNAKSPVLGVAQQVYQQTFGKAPQVTAIHAGLECGLIGEIYPEMDMISIGPQIEAPHSPDERVQISSVQRFWSYLGGLLAALA
jgi:dipeptidase D